MLQNLSNNRNRTSILNDIASFSITKGYSMYLLKALKKYKQPTSFSVPDATYKKCEFL